MIEQLHTIISFVEKYHFYDTKTNELRIVEADGILRDYIKRKALSTELYSEALFIATEIAEKRFDCDTIIAALFFFIPLSDFEGIYSQSSNFSNSLKRIYSILKAYKELDLYFADLYQAYKKNEEQITSEALKDINPQAFAIRVAQQKNSLLEKNLNNEEKLQTAYYTRDFFVPKMQMIGAYKDSDELLELCLMIVDNSVYMELQNQLRQCKKLRQDQYRSTLYKLKKIFDPNNKILPNELLDLQKHIKDFTYNERAIYSMYRYMCRKTSNAFDSFDNTISQNKLAIYDCTLIMKDSEEHYSPIDLFFSYYNYVLRTENIYIINYHQTTYRDSSYFILCDDMDNKYRLFIRSETEYLHYLYGDILEKESASFLPQKQERMINVFKRDGAVESIIEGATVLDLAFKIHGNLGLCFDYALLNNNPEHHDAYTVLNKGDTVEIFKKDYITAELKWFRRVKTDIALYHLYRYFKTEFDRLKRENYIDVVTRDGTTQTLVYGATALDLAFSIHKDIGLHFSHALINGNKTHMPAYTQLHHGDKVVICTSETITPKIQWFKYVKSDIGIRNLIKFFSKNEQI